MNNNAPATRGKEAEAGAVVAIDVKTGGVIAMASYPDYSLEEYYQTYSEMVQQSPSPLLNRATQGLYTVGSTYKPAVSLAALDTGTVTATDRIRWYRPLHLLPGLSARLRGRARPHQCH